MNTHQRIFTTPSANGGAGVSHETAAARGFGLSVVRMERQFGTRLGLIPRGLRGRILPHGGESAWASFDAMRLASTGGLGILDPIPPAAHGLSANAVFKPTFNSTICQSRGRMPINQ